MMPETIARFRRTFILIAMASFLVVIAFMGTATTISNIAIIRGQANKTIDAILDAGGEVPIETGSNQGGYEEAYYGLRFFTVTFDDAGEVVNVDLSHIALVDAAKALEVSQKAADPGTLTPLSRYEDYFYKEGVVDGGTMVVFLDCSLQLDNVSEVVSYTLILSVVAFIVTLVSVFFFSKRAVNTEMERLRAQQRFMTNASHELKTPIAVIRANTELTEMLSGETEWTRSTITQVDRLDGLVRDLMTIVRGQEQGTVGEGVSDVDVSAVVGAAVDSFRSVAQQQGKELSFSLESGVKLKGVAVSIEQLTCLLVDNAIKYCDEGGSIRVRLSPGLLGRGCTLVVSNDYAEGADVDYRRFFDRFYRSDESHENQQGYGIGLSVAESICNRYHGSIKATWKAGVISFTCVLKDL